MTTDYALLAIKQLVEQAAPELYERLQGVPVYVSQEDDVRSYPSITIEDSGAEEHEILRGVFDPLTVIVRLQTIPNDDEADGTTQETHRATSTQLYDLLACPLSIDFLNDYTALKVFDIRGIEPINEREDGRSVTSFTLEITCSKQT